MIENFVQDTNFWVGLSFAVFLLLVLRFGWPAIIASLDARIAAIKNDLAAAEQLHTEAHARLEEVKTRYQNAGVEADRIVDNARVQARAIAAEEEARFAALAQTRQKQLDGRLQQLQTEARADLQNYAANLALQTTETVIARSMTPELSARLVSKSLNIIEKTPVRGSL